MNQNLITNSDDLITIDGNGKNFKDLNREIKKKVNEDGKKNIELNNIYGQRYIGAGLQAHVNIKINGIPGNNLAAMCDGPRFEVMDNGQDMIGNTMNEGEVIIHGHVSDTPGIATRGGKIYIKEKAGYRVGIHMKAYQDKQPVLVVGENVGDFLGEYMAGGIIIILGLKVPADKSPVCDYVATGMHGGTIYIQGKVEESQLGKEVSKLELTSRDENIIKEHTRAFCSYFYTEADPRQLITIDKFVKLEPVSTRPYGRLYVS